MSSAIERTALIIIHTHNDSETIVKAVEDLCTNTFSSIVNWDWALLIIECRSSDDTVALVRAMKSTYRNLQVLENVECTREDGTFFAEFEKAINSLHADAIILMSVHHLKQAGTIGAALRKIDEGASLVLGSRKVKGGAWTREPRGGRQPGSRLESFLVRLALFFPTRFWFRVTDPTAGFMTFETVLLTDTLGGYIREVSGIASPLSLLNALVCGNANVAEVPVQAEDEIKDKKKFAATIKSAVRLRWREPETKRFLKFCAVGFIGYIINASALEFFRNVNLTYTISQHFAIFPGLSRYTLLTSQSAWAAAFAAEIAIISNYLLNNFWTFSRNRIHSPLRFVGKLLQFNLTSFGGIIIQFFVVGLATRILGDTPMVRGAALVFAVVFLIIPYNWTMYNRLIWRVKRRVNN